MSSAVSVYKGRWTDWEHGAITGMRITLSLSTGQLLLAAITLFVGICGLQSWSICRLLLHQMRPNNGGSKLFPGSGTRGAPGPVFGRDSLDQGTEQSEQITGGAPPPASSTTQHHIIDNTDMQFTLRNSTAFDAILRISKLSLSRLYHQLRVRPGTPARLGAPPFSHSWAIFIVLIALLNVAGWPIAAIFSSLVARADYPVLVSSPNCGYYIDMSNFINDSAQTVTKAHRFNAKEGARSRTADEYIQSCYYGSSSNPAESDSTSSGSSSPMCRRFVTRQIPWKPETNVPCPFAKSMCLGGDTSAFAMDTGYLDSHDVFGVNTPPDQRLLYRRRTVCSPINTIEHSKLLNGTLPGEKVRYYYYGGIGSPEEPTYLLSAYAQRGPVGYELRSYTKLKYIPELSRSDAQISLFFLIPGEVAYLGPVDDPIFAAHTDANDGDTIGKLYYSDKMASVVGCVDQRQICNPGSDRSQDPAGGGGSSTATTSNNPHRCTPMQRLGELVTPESGLGFTDLQLNISYTFQWWDLLTDMSFSVAGRNAEALLAGRTVFDGVNIQLPSDQWMKEVSNWFNIGLVRLQFGLLEYVTGPVATSTTATAAAASLGGNASAAAGGTEAAAATLKMLNSSSFQQLYGNTCLLQKVGQFNQAEDYLTVNTLGLALIIALGGFILVLGVALDLMVEWLPKHGWGWRRRWAWIDQDRFVVWRKLRSEGQH